MASLVEVGLTVAWWLLWAAFAAVSVAAIGYGVILALSAGGGIDADNLPTGNDVGAGVAGLGAYDNIVAAWPVLVPAMAASAVAVGGALIIVGRLRRLFASFTSGEPFRIENAGHLRVIWITMLATELARYVLLGAVAGLFAAVGAPAGAKAQFDISFDISTWMSIATLIALAEVFREGARMKEEQELTI